MTEIIPGIIANTLKELKEKLRLLSWAKKVHIDIMDGRFVPNKTITALTLKKALPRMDMQIHLMAYKPHLYVNKFARLGAKEFIFHAEATRKSAETLEMIRETGMKAGIAFNPETNIGRHHDALLHADIAHIMTVHPGFSGQAFMKAPLRKIAEIKKQNPVIVVGVDGGVNHKNCRLLKSADFAIATHAIAETQNPQTAYKQLSRACK